MHSVAVMERVIERMLKAHPEPPLAPADALVESIHAEAQERGGTAVTLVELRG